MESSIAFIFGLVFGSFLNVVILRIPKEESIVFGASHCLSCNVPLKFWHNIPLLSWIFLRGKCSFCQTSISKQYPFVELLSGLLFVMLANKYGINISILMIAFSFLMLIALSIIDIKYKMVPDSLNLLAIIFAILGAWDFEGILENFKNALLFAGGFTLLRFSLSYLLSASLSKELKQTQTSWNKNYDRATYIEAMGEGDIMVSATMGALLGIPLTLVAIFLSALIALPVMLYMQRGKEKQITVPYVPFLTIATFIVFVFDSPIMNYLKANY